MGTIDTINIDIDAINIDIDAIDKDWRVRDAERWGCVPRFRVETIDMIDIVLVLCLHFVGFRQSLTQLSPSGRGRLASFPQGRRGGDVT